jgi:hypothetical protein
MYASVLCNTLDIVFDTTLDVSGSVTSNENLYIFSQIFSFLSLFSSKL